MKFDASILKSWIATKELYLPGLGQLFSKTNSEILIIGAAVFEFYQMQGWISPFKRKTGDIDLSIGIMGDANLYNVRKDILLSLSYKVDDLHRYRYHSPKKIPGGFSYIDLLAHPADQKTKPEIATEAMGVGPDFSFKGFNFALTESFQLKRNVLFPNPFGLISLKKESYLNDPNRRTKDFADILELISGLVEVGTHFNMEDLWKKISKEPEAIELKKTLGLIARDDIRWEIESIRSDLLQRNFDANFIENTLPQRIKDFHDFLE